MIERKKCPICNAGTLQDMAQDVDVEHLGVRGTIRSQFSFCSACGSEQADALQVLSNKNAMIAFQNNVKQLAPERR